MIDARIMSCMGTKLVGRRRPVGKDVEMGADTTTFWTITGSDDDGGGLDAATTPNNSCTFTTGLLYVDNIISMLCKSLNFVGTNFVV